MIVADADANTRKTSIVFRRSSLANLQHVKPDIPEGVKIDLNLFPFMQKHDGSQAKPDRRDNLSSIPEQKEKTTAKSDIQLNEHQKLPTEEKVDQKTPSD